MIFGYARVSTADQDTAAQVETLNAAGAAKVFFDKISGVKADRPQLKKALASLDKGDVFLVTKIDRLARSARDLLNIVHEVTEAGATFKSLGEPWADTSSELSEFMLVVLAAVAKLDRATILARTAEGRARAKAKGKSLGRPHKLTKAQQAEARAMLAAGRSTHEVGEVFNVSHSTIVRLPSA